MSKDNFKDYYKVQRLAKSWEPIPDRNKPSNIKIRTTIQTNSNFMNCSGGYFNVGKFKGVSVKDVPVWYMNWVVSNINLNPTELKTIKKYIKLKENKK